MRCNKGPGILVLTISILHLAVSISLGDSRSLGASESVVSLSARATTHDDHDDCHRRHSYYRDVFDNAEKENCFSPYSVFQHLDYLRRHDRNCLLQLIGKMANPHSDRCRSSHSFQGIMNTYLTQAYHLPGATSRIQCHSRSKVWRDLLQLRNMDSHCIDDFVSHMYAAYTHNHEPSCHNACHSSSTHTSYTTHTQGTSPPTTIHSSHHHLSQSEKYELFKKGECLSEHTGMFF
ncbi:uncharacterized protein LOC134231134 [Saccostrea cucullata]|uniref:uncharacterized protein LOC134231134 n=1 Tax=Saccostrea cuccullata TaxID=36930 RepID=UPI002ED024C8